jgi:hypothetical protein
MTRDVANNPDITGQARRFGLSIENVTRQYTIGGTIVLFSRAPRHCTFAVHLNDATKLKQALALGDEMALASWTRVVVATRAAGLVLYQFQLGEGLWAWPKRADLEAGPGLVGLGVGDAMRRGGKFAQVNFEFDDSYPHAGIFGTSGSGKTEAAKSLLCGLATAYTPARGGGELGMVIIDTKGKFRDFANCAHLALPIARTDAEIDRALAFVDEQIKHREQNSLFDAPRIAVMIDEADAVLAPGARLAVAKSLVKRGREVNLNAIIATQEPEADTIRKHLLGQILNRYIGLVDSPAKSYALAGHGGIEAHKLSGKGDFAHVCAGGFRERLVVAMAGRADFDAMPRAEIDWPGEVGGNVADPDRYPPAGDLGDWWHDEQEPEDPDRGGRPVKDMDPDTLGHYLYFRPENITPKLARDRLGVSKYMHARYRDYADAVLRTIRYLKSEEVTL